MAVKKRKPKKRAKTRLKKRKLTAAQKLILVKRIKANIRLLQLDPRSKQNLIKRFDEEDEMLRRSKQADKAWEAEYRFHGDRAGPRPNH